MREQSCGRWGGVLGEPQASIFRAELKAVLEVLRIAVPPLRVHVDNAQVVQGFREGRQWCVSGKSCAADLWREVWDVYGDIEGGVEVVKVKAHTTWWEALAGQISARNSWRTRKPRVHCGRQSGKRLQDSSTRSWPGQSCGQGGRLSVPTAL